MTYTFESTLYSSFMVLRHCLPKLFGSRMRRADELAAGGKTGEEIAIELGVSAATLCNWRRAYGGMDTDAAKELTELREQNARLKRMLAEAELVKDALREVAKGKF